MNVLLYLHCLQVLHGWIPLHCRCFSDGQVEQAIGIALESRRLDKLEESVRRAPDTVTTLDYALQVCQRMVINREFRQQVRCVKFPPCFERRQLATYSGHRVSISVAIGEESQCGPAPPALPAFAV